MPRVYASLPLSGPARLLRSDAMALILEAVAKGGDDRRGVVDAALARHTPPTDYGCLGVVGGELVSA